MKSEEELSTRSVRRNPLIADLLHRIALIEKAGTGIRRMIEDAGKHKCPEPKFTVNGFFTATFWPNVELGRKITPEVTKQVGEVLKVGKPLYTFESDANRFLINIGAKPLPLNDLHIL
jgi:predicted HTH transcriptional regulator